MTEPTSTTAATAAGGLSLVAGSVFGHTPGKMQVNAPEISAEHPFTLDLRRF